MDNTGRSDRGTETRERGLATMDHGHALEVAIVYEDALSRDWAMQECDRVTGSLRRECLYNNLWRIDELTHPDVFVDAVLAAMWADVILVSVRGTHDVAVDLHVWIDAWLPRRCHRPGALMALIGAGDQPRLCTFDVRGYLEAVARRSRLDFLAQERQIPESLPTRSDSVATASRSHATASPANGVRKPEPGADSVLGVGGWRNGVLMEEQLACNAA